jgi:putative two-component system response regulator
MLTNLHETQADHLSTNIEAAVNMPFVANKPSASWSNLPATPKVMMVDDEKLNIYVVAEYLKSDGYRDLVYTNDSSQALSLAERERPDAILLDIHMPQLSGFEVLQQVRNDKVLARTPVVILSSSTDDDEKMRALELGATDFLHKPINSGELLARLRNILMAKAFQDHWQDYSKTLEIAVRQRTQELEESRRAVIDCLARAAEFRDDGTHEHMIRVGRYARIIGQQLGMDERSLDVLEQAAKLHDIGKIAIPDAILFKPGKLTPEEFEVMRRHGNFGKQIIECMPQSEQDQLRQHPQFGAEIFNAGHSPILTVAMKVSQSHHECWDGTGYPLGLVGEDIPLEGRITAVADVFDALSTRRPYRPAFPLEKCLSIMHLGHGAQFDPRVLDAFFARRDDIVQIQIECADVE